MINKLKQKIVSDNSAVRLGMTLCFAAACLVPVLVFRKFAEIELSEPQLLLGVLATMSLALLFTAIGLLLETKVRVSQSTPCS